MRICDCLWCIYLISIQDPAPTAEVVINTIQTLETDFQKKLDQFYVQMHDSTFKNMRRYDMRCMMFMCGDMRFFINFVYRFLPKNGQKMNWRASTHAVIAEAASK